MRERPILFSGEMVRAILAGRKTQTRRPIQGALGSPNGHVYDYRPRPSAALHRGTLADLATLCPLGAPGDRLWVRETWSSTGAETACYRADCPIDDSVRRSGHDPAKNPAHRWRPSIHMPRWASRLTLVVENVRVEVDRISEVDARAEGFACVDEFEQAWDRLYPGRRQRWAVTFRREAA